MAIDIENPGADQAALSAALRALVNTFDNITTGAAPVTPNPETDVTFITTGGTQAVETINMEIPANPELKVGKLKRLILVTQVDPSDQLHLDLTNMVGSGADAEEGAFFDSWMYIQGAYAVFELTYAPQWSPDTAKYAWQFNRIITESYRRIFINEIIGSDAQDAPSINIKAGFSNAGDAAGVAMYGGGSAVGSGGAVGFYPGSGVTDGGDLIADLPVGGSGRNGQMIIGGLPTSDPAIANAFWNDAGTLKISAG